MYTKLSKDGEHKKKSEKEEKEEKVSIPRITFEFLHEVTRQDTRKTGNDEN